MNTDHFKNRLDAFSRHFVPVSTAVRQHAHPERYQRLADHLGGTLIPKENGAFCCVTTRYPFDYCYSAHAPEEWNTVRSFPHSAFSLYDRDEVLPVEHLLYFDTETTGLGGAGTVPFLIGCGSMTSNGFEIRQYLIPDYSDEPAMLDAILREFSDHKTLVTYNGAAFDLPVLRDRLIINRTARELPDIAHVDLLPPTRRLFKRRLKVCNLTNIERELLGHYRDDDIPGYLIPSVYFAWLADESLDLLSQVLAHNRQDILSLHFLATHIARAFRSEGQTLSEIDDLHSLSRIYGRRKRHDKVVALTGRMAHDSVSELPQEILLYQSLALKRSGSLEQAVTIWEKLSEMASREGYLSCLELSKFCEHKVGDLPRALDYALRAQRFCPVGQRHLQYLQIRVDRLSAKVASS